MSDQAPQIQADAEDELSPEELEEAAGGIGTNSGVCNSNCAVACKPGG